MIKQIIRSAGKAIGINVTPISIDTSNGISMVFPELDLSRVFRGDRVSNAANAWRVELVDDTLNTLTVVDDDEHGILPIVESMYLGRYYNEIQDGIPNDHLNSLDPRENTGRYSLIDNDLNIKILTFNDGDDFEDPVIISGIYGDAEHTIHIDTGEPAFEMIAGSLPRIKPKEGLAYLFMAGVFIQDSTAHVTIEHLEIVETYNYGPKGIKASTAGQDGQIIILNGNIIHDLGNINECAGISVRTTRPNMMTVSNNIVYNVRTRLGSDASGSGWGIGGVIDGDIDIFNNIVVNPNPAVSKYGSNCISLSSVYHSIETNVFNNICISDGGPCFQLAPYVRSTNNFMSDESTLGLDSKINVNTEDYMFMDFDNFDFRLNPGSIAENSGKPNASNRFDFYGNKKSDIHYSCTGPFNIVKPDNIYFTVGTKNIDLAGNNIEVLQTRDTIHSDIDLQAGCSISDVMLDSYDNIELGDIVTIGSDDLIVLTIDADDWATLCRVSDSLQPMPGSYINRVMSFAPNTKTALLDIRERWSRFGDAVGTNVNIVIIITDFVGSEIDINTGFTRDFNTDIIHRIEVRDISALKEARCPSDTQAAMTSGYVDIGVDFVSLVGMEFTGLNRFDIDGVMNSVDTCVFVNNTCSMNIIAQAIDEDTPIRSGVCNNLIYGNISNAAVIKVRIDGKWPKDVYNINHNTIAENNAKSIDIGFVNSICNSTFNIDRNVLQGNISDNISLIDSIFIKSYNIRWNVSTDQDILNSNTNNIIRSIAFRSNSDFRLRYGDLTLYNYPGATIKYNDSKFTMLSVGSNTGDISGMIGIGIRLDYLGIAHVRNYPGTINDNRFLSKHMGIGDMVTIDTADGEYREFYIVGKSHDFSSVELRDIHGDIPEHDLIEGSIYRRFRLSSVKRVFSKLANVFNDTVDGNLRSSLGILDKNIVANGVNVDIICYYDNDVVDVDQVLIDSWICNRYFNISVRVPKNTVNECGYSQRHNGYWSESAYRLDGSGADIDNMIRIKDTKYISIDGIQVKMRSSSGTCIKKENSVGGSIVDFVLNGGKNGIVSIE